MAACHSVQWAASNASWIAFEIRPRVDTSYPEAFAHSRIAWTWSRLDGTGAALPLGPGLAGANFATFTAKAAFTNRASFSRNLPALEAHQDQVTWMAEQDRQVVQVQDPTHPNTPHTGQRPGPNKV